MDTSSDWRLLALICLINKELTNFGIVKHDLAFYWRTLSRLGEQAVLNSEIHAQGTTPDSEVFGYQERYAEYRYKPSEIRGQFRSTFAQTLDVWHLAEEFNTLLELNSTFIQSNTPIERSLAVTASYPHLS